MINWEKAGDRLFNYVMAIPFLILILVLSSVKGDYPNQYVDTTWWLMAGIFISLIITVLFIISMIFYSKL